MMNASYNLRSRDFLIFMTDFTLYSHFFFSISKCNVQLTNLALKFQLLLFWLNCIWFELFIDTLINSYVLL